jgi:F-type H+-transporting ATPase subunit b
MMTWTVVSLPLAAAGGGEGSFLSVDTTLLWSTLVLFTLFAWVLGRFAWGPLLRIVDEREKGIRDSVESAERAAGEAKALLARHQEMLRDAGREREEILARALKEAETVRTDIVAKTREQMQHEKNQAIAELREQVADIAVEAAGKIVKSSLTPEAQKKLVDDYITSLPRA